MKCGHERLKSVNCVIYCAICGAMLPPETLKDARTEAPEKKPRKKKKTDE